MSLNTRKKRKKDILEEPIVQDSLIFQLPEETLLKIFKYLSTEDRILAAGFVKIQLNYF